MALLHGGAKSGRSQRPPRDEPHKPGVVYLARARGYDRIKVGYWTSTLEQLRSRYATPYGPDFDLLCFPTPSSLGLERRFKARFVQLHVCGELYDARGIPSFVAFLREQAELDAEPSPRRCDEESPSGHYSRSR